MLMGNNFKYLTCNPNDKSWGLNLKVAGMAKIDPLMPYPPKGHPSGHDFWDKGRILNEYQLNYITAGEGILETRSAKYGIVGGSIIFLHPNRWHRYKPIIGKGWIEHYIGFRGEIADKIIQSSDILRNMNVMEIGFHESILRSFNEIISEANNERPGYHQICSGLVVQILGQIISIRKNKNFIFSSIESDIQKACVIIRQNLLENINVEKLAFDLNLDYSQFRKAFKRYTGLSPMQYHMALRMKQATHLLGNSDLSIKQIASKLGFCSQYYFCKLFKEKTGKTPSQYRQRARL